MRHWLQECKWPEVEEYLKREDIILVPVGSTEQHGPHAPLSTDAAEAIAVCDGVARRAGVLSAPPVWYGWAPHHMRYPGTVTLRPETLMAVVEDICESLVYHGFKKIIVVNGHRVANLPPLEIAAVKVRNRTGAYVAIVDLALVAIVEIREICQGEVGAIGHGCESETSFMMYAHGDLVDVSKAVKQVRPYDPKLLGGFIFMEPSLTWNRVWSPRTVEEEYETNKPWGGRGDPTLATAEKGRQIYEAIVKNTVEFLERVRQVPVTIKARSVPI
jgi:creatinine amidohydrolase